MTDITRALVATRLRLAAECLKIAATMVETKNDELGKQELVQALDNLRAGIDDLTTLPSK